MEVLMARFDLTDAEWSIVGPLSPGQASDKTVAPTVIEGLKAARDLVADRDYDARVILELVERRGGRAHIPTCCDRKVQRSVDRELYRQRNLVERFFNKLKHFRRIATPMTRPLETSSPRSCLQPLAYGLGLSPRPSRPNISSLRKNTLA
jgi:transposase